MSLQFFLSRLKFLAIIRPEFPLTSVSFQPFFLIFSPEAFGEASRAQVTALVRSPDELTRYTASPDFFNFFSIFFVVTVGDSRGVFVPLGRPDGADGATMECVSLVRHADMPRRPRSH